MDRETVMLREIWLKAMRSEEPVRLTFPNEAAAIRMRFALYNSVKRVRSGKDVEGNAAEVKRACEECGVKLDPKERSTLIVYQKLNTEMMAILAEVLGVRVEDVRTPEELAIEASLARMKQLVAGEALGKPVGTGAAKNPYYTRDTLGVDHEH